MSESSARAHLKTIVSAVTDVGQVHDYERWAGRIPDLLDSFKYTTSGGVELIRGWTIACRSIGAEWLLSPEDEAVGHPQRVYGYVLRGYFSLQDVTASEKTAIGLVEDVMDALDKSTTLHSESSYWGITPPSRLTVFEPRMFGSILCHYAEIIQELTEDVSLS